MGAHFSPCDLGKDAGLFFILIKHHANAVSTEQ
jgi:hypothetical protein